MVFGGGGKEQIGTIRPVTAFLSLPPRRDPNLWTVKCKVGPGDGGVLSVGRGASVGDVPQPLKHPVSSPDRRGACHGHRPHAEIHRLPVH